jgi:hypothetical protein
MLTRIFFEDFNEKIQKFLNKNSHDDVRLLLK